MKCRNETGRFIRLKLEQEIDMKWKIMKKVILASFGFAVLSVFFQNCSGLGPATSQNSNNSTSNAAANEDSWIDKLTLAEGEIQFISNQVRTTDPGDSIYWDFEISRLPASNISTAETFTYEIRCAYSDKIQDNVDMKLFENQKGEIKFESGEVKKLVRLNFLSIPNLISSWSSWSGRRFLLKVSNSKGTLVADRIFRPMGVKLASTGGLDLTMETNPYRLIAVKIDDKKAERSCSLCFPFQLKFGTASGNDLNHNIEFFNYDQKLAQNSQAAHEGSKVKVYGQLEKDYKGSYPNQDSSTFGYITFERALKADGTLLINSKTNRFVLETTLSSNLSEVYKNSQILGISSYRKECVNSACENGDPIETVETVSTGISIPFQSKIIDPLAGSLSPQNWNFSNTIAIQKSSSKTAELVFEGLERYAKLFCFPGVVAIYYWNDGTQTYEKVETGSNGLYYNLKPGLNKVIIEIDSNVTSNIEIRLFQFTSADGTRSSPIQHFMVQD